VCFAVSPALDQSELIGRNDSFYTDILLFIDFLSLDLSDKPVYTLCHRVQSSVENGAK
jgi:hypothetical protein